MARLKALATAWVGGFALVATAQAADMPQNWRPPAPPPVVDLQSGWYLRGDIGYRAPWVYRAQGMTGFPAPTDHSFSGVFWGGVGAGVKWNALRTDLTLDYAMPSTYSGNDGNGNTASAKVQAMNVMVNMYYDIGTWRGITPYVGAGAGTAYVKVSDYQSTTIPPLSGVGGHPRWNLAWSVMTGVSYRFMPNLSLDVGYRYLNMGDAETAAGTGGKLTLKSLNANEFRIGVRWMYESSSAYYR